MTVPRRRFPRAIGWLAKLLLGLLFASLLAEGAVLLVLGEQPKFPRRVVGAPFGLRINEPGATYRHKSADMTTWFRINRNGMRADHDYAYEKQPGTVRIVSLGDSFTVGYEVDVEDCFSSVLESELRRSGLDVEVLNAGVSGYSTAEECLYLERELIRYEPDVVVVSFYANDLVDNVRTGLFALDGERLVQEAETYVPLGAIGNFLNRNWLFGLLAERSNAFALVKERGTYLLKERMVRENEESLRAPDDAEAVARQQLTAAIFERMYAFLRERGIPLVIHSIASPTGDPPDLVDSFPLASFDVDRPDLAFVSSREVLLPFAAREQLYWHRSHGHWTPFSHRAAGRALAERIRGLLPTR